MSREAWNVFIVQKSSEHWSEIEMLCTKLFEVYIVFFISVIC